MRRCVLALALIALVVQTPARADVCGPGSPSGVSAGFWWLDVLQPGATQRSEVHQGCRTGFLNVVATVEATWRILDADTFEVLLERQATREEPWYLSYGRIDHDPVIFEIVNHTQQQGIGWALVAAT